MRSTSKRRPSGAAISGIRIPTASPAGDRAVSGIRLRPALLLLLFAMLPAHASLAIPPDEEPPAVETAEQEDPTRAVFFSIRDEFIQVDSDTWVNALIVRSDRAILRERPDWLAKTGILTRFDLPIVTSHRNDDTESGLGDLYAQAALVPWLTRRSAFVIGSGITVPTATDDSLGRGKWEVAPVVVPAWFLPQRRGLFFVRLHDHLSFAGDDDRADVHFLEIVPTLIWNYRPGWWTLLTSPVIVDWENGGSTRQSTGIEIGHVVRRRWGVAVKPELFWGSNRAGDWKVTFSVTRYRRK
ncbi:MAG: transporter [Thermoanaerobaculia bacterium]